MTSNAFDFHHRYVELLEKEEELPEHVKDYIKILSKKSQRLKTMVQDIFDVSKAPAEK